MNKQALTLLLIITCCAFILTRCSENKNTGNTTPSADSSTVITGSYNGYETNVKWGEHLVLTLGCNDCHTPKKMGPKGPVNDESLTLAGHWSSTPIADIDRKMVQKKGLAVTTDETAWIGPWGISYASNLTPDSTGIGSWTEDQFIRCLRDGKYMGLETGRDLLPPMPWPTFRNLSDNELKAVFAYLKSIKPIHNVVPAAAPPIMN